MAEAILQRQFLLEDILIASKGLVVLFPEPINPKVEAVLVSNGLSMKDHVSEPLLEEDFDERTLVLTMDSAQKSRLLRSFENPRNVFTLAEYIRADIEVKDPYGGPLSDYGKCFEDLKEQVDRLAGILMTEDSVR
jgi:protein-tyrosine-phosphatase